jgi:hypothetical protein
MLKRTILWVAVVAALLGAGFAAPGGAQAAPAAAQRIHFPAGSTSYVLSTTLAPGVPQSYVLGIRAGQTLYITNFGGASVRVYGPYGNWLAGPTTAQGPWGVYIPQSGDYWVTLGGSGAVTIIFAIPAGGAPANPPVRIRFAPGNASASFSTSLVQGAPNRYVLGIWRGQTLYVQVVGDENATVSVSGPGGRAVSTVRTGRPGTWMAYAAATGDYVVSIYCQGQVWVTMYVPPR